MDSNKAAIRLTLDGTDISAGVNPRRLSLTLSEKRGEAADQLDLVLQDHDGKLAVPRKGVTLSLSLGWAAGDEVTVAMVDKGTFKVDEVEVSGPPDVVTVRARSADLTAAYRTRRDKAHTDTTLGAIVRKVAADNGLKAHVDAGLAAIPVKALAQSAKSDMAFVRDLGRRYDATATVKDGKLIFAPVGIGKTASGKAMPAIVIARRDGDRYTYRLVDRDVHDGVEAQWHDKGAAKRKKVKVGGGNGSAGGGKPKRLKRIYATEGDARAAASAEATRIARRTAEFEFDMALGRPDLGVEQTVTLKGWKAEIDARRWVVAEVTHTIDGQSGLKTALKLETL